MEMHEIQTKTIGEKWCTIAKFLSDLDAITFAKQVRPELRSDIALRIKTTRYID